MNLISFLLIFLFFSSFSEWFTPYFNILFVSFGVSFFLLRIKSVFIPKELFYLILFVTIYPTFQFIFTGNIAFKWLLNYFLFIISIIGYLHYFKNTTFQFKNQIFIRLKIVLVFLITIYILYPIFDLGIYEVFTKDGNLVFSSSNTLLPKGFLEKQKMSPLITLYVIVLISYLLKIKNFYLKFIIFLLLIIAINALFSSRSQIVGFLLSLVMIFLIRNKTNVSFGSFIFCFGFLLFFLFLSTEFFSQLANLDIRVMLFHVGSLIFFKNIIFGIGLFYSPIYLKDNNNLLFSEFSWLNPITFQKLISFPVGFESSFVQFTVELGIIFFIFLYFVLRWFFNIYYSVDVKFKSFILFGIIYFFSSMFEDNLTQPAFLVIFIFLVGFSFNKNF
jgi:hypothetical protein